MGEFFTKQDRILKSAEFRRVLRHGRRFARPHVTVVACRGKETRTRVGLTVSRKVGNAVVRNRVKRRLREIVRKNRSRLGAHWDLVLIAHPGSGTASYDLLERQLLEAFEEVEQHRPRRRGRRRNPRRRGASGHSEAVAGK